MRIGPLYLALSTSMYVLKYLGRLSALPPRILILRHCVDMVGAGLYIKNTRSPIFQLLLSNPHNQLNITSPELIISVSLPQPC